MALHQNNHPGGGSSSNKVKDVLNSAVNSANKAVSNARSNTAKTQPESNSRVLTVRDNVIRWRGNMIAIPHIEYIYSGVPRYSFPLKLTIACVILAILLIVIPGTIIVSWAPLLVAIAAIAMWYRKKTSAPRCVQIHLNSGNSLNLTFSDHDFAFDVLDAIEKCIQDSSINIRLEMPANVKSEYSDGKLIK